jgi:hypothetical protein
MFAYNVSMATKIEHPAKIWQQDAKQPHQTTPNKLRLAAMAGHMQIDKIAARRAALIDLLADGRPHPRQEIWETIATQLREKCWGKVPQEALARDLSALRQGGIRIAYSRRPEIQGYYLQHPPLKRPLPRKYESTNWQLVDAIRQLPVSEKNRRVFAAADFAFRQKCLLLREDRPNWSETEIEEEARRLVYGIAQEDIV